MHSICSVARITAILLKDKLFPFATSDVVHTWFYIHSFQRVFTRHNITWGLAKKPWPHLYIFMAVEAWLERTDFPRKTDEKFKCFETNGDLTDLLTQTFAGVLVPQLDDVGQLFCYHYSKRVSYLGDVLSAKCGTYWLTTVNISFFNRL